MKNIFSILFIAAFLGSCNQKNAQQEVTVLTIDTLLSDPGIYTDKTVEITGTVSHVCRHGGQKMFLFGENPEKLIQVNTGTSATEFDVALEGTELVVTAVVKELRIDEAYIAAMEDENSKADSLATSHESDSLSIHQHEANMQNVAYLRKQVAESGKGYISEFWLEATAFNPLKK